MLKYIGFGNLTGRYSDGVFQKNAETNAFYKKIMTIIKLKVIPKDMQNIIIDFTPIDLISNAIYKLIFESKDDNIIYHLYNSKTMTIGNLIDLLNEIGFSIKTISKEDIRKLSKNDKKQINELMFEIYPTTNRPNITIQNCITDEILKKNNFEWKEIDKEYLLKTINYVREVMKQSYENN